MPSPFPGMDPYLEEPAVWPGFHNKFINEVEVALTHLLLPKYFARSEERVYVSTTVDPGRKTIVPDVHLVSTGRKMRPVRSKGAAGTATAVLECEPVEIVFPSEVEV